MASGESNLSHSTGSTMRSSDSGRDPFVEEVADAVAVVFASIEPTRDDLVAQALRNGAHPTVIAALQALPRRRYRTLRQVRMDLLRLQQE